MTRRIRRPGGNIQVSGYTGNSLVKLIAIQVAIATIHFDHEDRICAPIVDVHAAGFRNVGDRNSHYESGAGLLELTHDAIVSALQEPLQNLLRR